MNKKQAIVELVHYILDSESEDFYNTIDEHEIDITPSNWKDINHIYVCALIVANSEPDWHYIRVCNGLREVQRSN